MTPFIRTLVRWRLHPNLLTTIGFGIAVGAAVAFDQLYVRTAGFLVLLSGFFDIIDGQVARLSGQGSKFGAFYDATLDRVGEIVVFIGLLALFGGSTGPHTDPWMMYAVVVAMAGSLMVSYTKSKAETMGLDCDVGLMRRAERVILVGVAALGFGLAWNGAVLRWAIIAMAVLTTFTAVQRVVWVYQNTSPREQAAVDRGEA